MNLPHDLIDFLLKAKRRTYAGTDDDATVALPLLLGSKQLEHAEGPYLYRDIYVGMTRFVGQEIVYERQRLVWSMSYNGGLEVENAEPSIVRATYAFLRACLLKGTPSLPYRGPANVVDGALTYQNVVDGPFEQFSGRETISSNGAVIYALRYGGGVVR